jgi:hypothetical protein
MLSLSAEESMRGNAKLRFAILLLFATPILIAQSAPPEIVGRWVAQNRSKGGIGSIWEFKRDGTLRMAPGAIVDVPYTLEGDKLILPPETTLPGAKPQVLKIRIEGDALYRSEDAPNAPEEKFVRLKSAKPGDPPIVGTWKASIPKTMPGNKAPAALQQAARNTTYTYTRDGIVKLRVPFMFLNGRYDSGAHTFVIDRNGKPIKGNFRIEEGKLYLTQPDGHTEDVYIRDDFE